MTDSRWFYRRALVPAAVLVAVACCAGGWSRAAQAQVVWELTPYQFQVYLAVATIPELPPEVVDAMGRDLVDRVDATIGAAWNMSVSTPEPPLCRMMLAGLEEVDAETIPKADLTNDKVVLVSVKPDINGYEVRTREYDVSTQVFSATVTKHAAHGALLSDALFSSVTETFAPLALIKSEDGEQVELRLRAGRFQSRDPSLLAVQPGEIFQPIIRYDDRDGKPKKILALPWTYLAVQQADQARLVCQLHSGLRTALAGRRRGRVQELALAIRPPARPTRLTLQSRSASKRPLGGYDIFLQKPGEKSTEWLGRTDLSGSIMIPPAPYLLHIVYVRSGGQLLAKLPLVPGLEEAVVASVTDDDQRLAAEGVVMAAQEELVDLVTRRAVLAARISAAIKSGDVDTADELLVQLNGLTTRDQFTQQLDRQRKKIISDDLLITRRIDMMFDEVRKLAVQYLDPEEVNKLGDQVRAAKQAANAASRP